MLNMQAFNANRRRLSGARAYLYLDCSAGGAIGCLGNIVRVTCRLNCVSHLYLLQNMLRLNVITHSTIWTQVMQDYTVVSPDLVSSTHASLLGTSALPHDGSAWAY